MIHFPVASECLGQAPSEALLETHTLRVDGDFEPPHGLPPFPRRLKFLQESTSHQASLPGPTSLAPPWAALSITNAFHRASLGGSGVKNPPANARDTGSIPDPGRSHRPQSNEACAPHLLSLCSRSREVTILNPHASDTGAHGLQERSPRTTAGEGPRLTAAPRELGQQQRPSTVSK